MLLDNKVKLIATTVHDTAALNLHCLMQYFMQDPSQFSVLQFYCNAMPVAQKIAQ